MPDGLRLALTTLSIAPVRGPRSIDRRTAGQAMSLAPLVGLLMGLLAASVLVVFRVLGDFRSPPLMACALTVGTLAVLSRGLHLDGLADLADGLGSSLPAERARAVMKQPDVGALGLATVVIVLMVQVGALLGAAENGRGTVSTVLSVVTARIAVTAACRGTAAATPDGLGALVAGTVRRGVPMAWALVAAATGAAYEVIDHDGPVSRAQQLVDSTRPVLAVALGLGAALLLRRHAVRRLGGLTGDVLGALVETVMTVVLVVMASDLPLSWAQALDRAVNPAG